MTLLNSVGLAQTVKALCNELLGIALALLLPVNMNSLSSAGSILLKMQQFFFKCRHSFLKFKLLVILHCPLLHHVEDHMSLLIYFLMNLMALFCYTGVLYSL